MAVKYCAYALINALNNCNRILTVQIYTSISSSPACTAVCCWCGVNALSSYRWRHARPCLLLTVVHSCCVHRSGGCFASLGWIWSLLFRRKGWAYLGDESRGLGLVFFGCKSRSSYVPFREQEKFRWRVKTWAMQRSRKRRRMGRQDEHKKLAGRLLVVTRSVVAVEKFRRCRGKL